MTIDGIDNPVMSRAYHAGREAYRLGVSYDANPYRPGLYRIDWATGHEDESAGVSVAARVEAELAGVEETFWPSADAEDRAAARSSV